MASGNGSNFEALVQACRSGSLAAACLKVGSANSARKAAGSFR
jgi:folate-dependent phosphoribosylglycinamide formyltransferase PurN